MHRILGFLFAVALVSSPVLAARQRASIPPVDPNAPVYIGREIGVSDAVTYGPANSGLASSPRAATNGDQSMVVWHQTQFVRIDREARPIEPLPVTIPGLAWDVVWDGHRYLIAASRFASETTFIQLIGVSADGRVEFSRTIDSAPGYIQSMSMALRGADVAVAHLTSFNQVFRFGVAIATTEGAPLRRFDTGLAATPDTSIGIDAWPGGYLVIWGGALLLHDDATTQRVSRPVGGDRGVATVWNGSTFFVVSADASGLNAFQVTTSGAVTPAVTIAVSPFGAYMPSVSRIRDGYRVLWKQARNAPQRFGSVLYDLVMIDADASGALTGITPLVQATNDISTIYGGIPDAPSMVFTSDSMLLLWARRDTASRSAWAAAFQKDERLSEALVASRARLLTRSAYPPTLANLLAVPAAADVFLANVDALTLAAKELELTEIDNGGRRTLAKNVGLPSDSVRVAWNGAGTTAVWKETTPDGVVSGWAGQLDSNGDLVTRFQIPTTRRLGGFTSIVCGPSDCATSFTTYDANGSNAIQYLQRLAPNGAPLDSPVAPPGSYFGFAPLGRGYLVVMRWESGQANVTMASRFEDGRLSEVTPVLEETAGSIAFVISRGSECLVAVERRVYPSLILARVGLDGKVVASAEVPLSPSVRPTWDGRNWLLAWTTSDHRILAARIRPDLSDLDLVALSATGRGERLLDLASIGDGSFVFAYALRDYDVKYAGAERVFVRWGEDR